jgi:hypothetical protein
LSRLLDHPLIEPAAYPFLTFKKLLKLNSPPFIVIQLKKQQGAGTLSSITKG